MPRVLVVSASYYSAFSWCVCMQSPIGGETRTSEGRKPETELTISLVGPVGEVAVKVVGNMHDGRDEGDLQIGGHRVKKGVVSGYAPKERGSRLVMCFVRSE